MAYPDADANGDQAAEIALPGGNPINANTLNGNVRTAWFSIYGGTGVQSENYNWALTRIPKGARLMGGQVEVTANPGSNDFKFQLSSLSGDSTIAITTLDGAITTNDQTALGGLGSAATSSGGAGIYTFNVLAIQMFGVQVDEETILNMNVDTANMTTSTSIVGYLRYTL